MTCNCEQKEMRLKELENSMTGAVEKYEEDINLKYTLEREIDTLKYKIECIKEEIMINVMEEKTPIGQPKYTSDEKRRTAQNQKLREHNEYEVFRESINQKIENLEKCKARIEIHKLHIKRSEYNLNLEQLRK